MPIVPDEKDWTWVLDEVCPECGFDTAAVDRDELASRIARTTDVWRAILVGPDVRERPNESTWSPLEYACHVRDVHRVYAGRVGRMLAEDDPHYDNWDQDATAVEERYAEQDPATVARELAAAGATLGDLFAGVDGAELGADRPAQRRRLVHRRLDRPLLPPRHRAPHLGRHGSVARR